MNTDLTVGKPWKVLLKYILPLFGSAVFQQLYTLADTIIAGRFAGQTALTAIGASNAIVNILMAVSLGANAGCAVLVSRYFGARQNGRTNTTIYTALISFAILSVLLATAGVATCRLILTALKTPQEALSESIDYLNIYYFGLPFLMLYNLGTGIFSALGDSRTPFIFLVFSSVANIVLDYFMVQDSGVRGVAWATFIAQGVACVLTLIFVFLRASKFKSDESKKVYSFGLLKLLLLLSLPIVLQNSFVSVGNLILQVRINELAQVQGIGITSGFTAGSKLVVFCTTCICTCASGLTNFVSQNYGAHKFKRIKRGFGSSLVISSVIASLFVAACLIFTEPLINLFMAQGEDVELAMSSAAQYIRIVAPFYLVVNVKVNADATVRGCNGNVGFMVSTFSDLIFRVGLVYVLTPFMGFAGVGWAWAIGWVLGTVVAVLFYAFTKCLRKSYIEKYDAELNQPEDAESTCAAV